MIYYQDCKVFLIQERFTLEAKFAALHRPTWRLGQFWILPSLHTML